MDKHLTINEEVLINLWKTCGYGDFEHNIC